MNTYTITETQTINCTRDGYDIQAKNLSAAKMIATKGKSFYGTVLSIYENGSRVAFKASNGWVSTK